MDGTVVVNDGICNELHPFIPHFLLVAETYSEASTVGVSAGAA